MLSSRRVAVGRWPLPLSSTHASNGVTGGAGWWKNGAETRDVCTMAGQAPRGVMLLGAAHIVAENLSVVKYC